MRAGKIFALTVSLLLAVCAIVFILYHTSWGTDDYKTFYVTDENYNIYSTSDSETIPVTSGKKFNVRYSLSKKTGYTAKVYSYVIEDNVFGYTVDGEAKNYTTDIDLTEQFGIKLNEKSFTLVMPESMSHVLQSVYSDKTVTLTDGADITKTAYFKLVVTSTEDDEKQIIIRLKGKAVGYLETDVNQPSYGNPEAPGNNPETHVHVFSEGWTYDRLVHYHMAICGCDLEKDREEHIYDGNNCTVCGWYRYPAYEHTEHTYDTTTWYNNESEHWHEATCGHYIRTDIAEHTYEYGKCSECGYNGGFDYDSSEHWREVINYMGLAIKEDWEKHTFDSDGRCTVCGYNSDPGNSDGSFGGGGGHGRSVDTGN